MAKADMAALLALSAALFIAIGDVIHQRSAHQVTDEPAGNIGLLTRLLREHAVVARQPDRRRSVADTGGRVSVNSC